MNLNDQDDAMMPDEPDTSQAQMLIASEIAARVREIRAMAEHADLNLLAYLLDIVASAADEDRLRAQIGFGANPSARPH